MTEIAFESATEIARRIRGKELGSLELTDYYIDRIEKLDGDINAVIVRDFERARDAARQADARLAAGEPTGPLHGVPMTIKEAYDIEGLPTTWGIPAFAGNAADSDAASVKSYKAAGAVFLGKTNVPLGLADLQSYNDIYGTTNNPWDGARGPGGSSGGSAAALAAGLSALESGSDIAGSIRNPAHYCGVYGHKPTWGIVPPQGHALPGVLAPPDVAVCGPMARYAEDLALALDVLAGPDALAAPGWQLALPKPSKKSLAEFKVAIWANDDLAPVDREVADRATGLGEKLAELGATVSTSARPGCDVKQAHVGYLTLLNAIMGAAVPKEQYERGIAAAEKVDPDDFSDAAVMMRAAALRHRGWLVANNQREHLRRAWNVFFDEWDILICPVTATPAFPHDHRPFGARTIEVNGEQQPYFTQIFWAGLVGGARLPSTVFPTGPSSEGLPIGLQAVGREYDDLKTIDFTRLVAEHLGGFTPPARLSAP
jgi:amidase